MIKEYEGVWCTKCESLITVHGDRCSDTCYCGHAVLAKKDFPETWIECVVEIKEFLSQ